MRKSALVLAAASLATAVFAGGVLLDTKFADGNSQIQDLANNSVWLFNGRTTTVRTEQKGSVSFDVTNAGGSEGVWAFFTDSGKPVDLGVGDRLSVAVTFSLSGFQNNGQDIRWGVLDSKGTRNTANLAGGMNDATFINDTGYGLDYFASGAGSPFVVGRRSVLSNANVFNNFGDFTAINGTGADARQSLADGVSYTLTYVVERVSASDTRITASVTGGTLAGLDYAAVETSAAPNTTFDYFAFRISGPGFATKLTFTELKVAYDPAPPSILSQPQPPALTLQVGGTANMAIAAAGSAISYQWTKDGSAVLNNDSALTPNLTVANVQLADAGLYRCVVSNAGGSVTSQPVTLKVSVDPVAPPPSITRQPASSTTTVDTSATLSVSVSGDGLFYQWFRNGVLLVGSTASQLAFSPAQVADSADYYVIVSNSSGSVVSAKATLLVVSPMTVTSFAPKSNATGLCVDTPLSIQFDRPVRIGNYGRINIWNSAGKVIDSIDVAANPQTRIVGGTPYAYFPVIVNGAIANIYPHQPLSYNESYVISVDPWVFIDANGAPFVGFVDSNTWRIDTQAQKLFFTVPTSIAVAADGSGDYCTVQAAIDSISTNNTKPVTITVQAGTYVEMVYVPSSKPFLTIRGTDRDKTVIQYADNNNLNPSNARAMFGVDAPDFTLQDITLWNTTPRGGSQAEAFRGNNKRILLNRVNLKSYQDTIWLQGTGAVLNSYIEGDVDFMWGYGSVYFKNTEMKALTSGGYYTQIRNDTGVPGNVYVDCKLTAPDGVTGMYLGRIDPAVFPYSQVVHINSQMGPHIAPAGWLLNNSTTAPSISYWEYNSTDATGAPLDVSQRLSFSRQISEDEATQWSDPANVLGGWVPSTVNALAMADGSLRVDWTAAHGTRAFVGLYRVGASDGDWLARQAVGESTFGQLRFGSLAQGDYEVRLMTKAGRAAETRVTKPLY